MKKEIGKGPMIGAIALAVIIGGFFVYKSMAGPAYDQSEKARNDAAMKISDNNFNRVNESIDGKKPAEATTGN